jgi:siroheme synthase
MGGHTMLVNPFVNGVIADPEVLADLGYRQPAVFHLVHAQNSTGVLVCGHVRQRRNRRDWTHLSQAKKTLLIYIGTMFYVKRSLPI